MSLQRFVLPGLVLGLVLSVMPSVAKAVPVSTTVFGNLGSSGSGPLGTGILEINQAAPPDQAAQSFNTGASTFGKLQLRSVQLGLRADTAGNFSVKLYDGDSFPNATELTTSSAAAVSTSASIVTFGFSDYQLVANKTYWIVVDSALDWYNVASNQPNAGNPQAQNGWSYSWPASPARNLQSDDAGATWVGADVARLSISVNAVPEPSTYAMAGIGAGLIGLTQLRRRLIRTATRV